MFISGDMVTHTGANPGYNAFFAFYKGYYVSILLNAGEGVRLGEKIMTTGVGYILEDVFNAIADM